MFPTEWNALTCVLRQENYWQDSNEDSLTNVLYDSFLNQSIFCVKAFLPVSLKNIKNIFIF